ncbi:MAG: WxcM-like domain-containing protein [Bacteroidetes bacterium]|nr:WxcM-like domain-containing protein [Bacteroidota bacterium]
MENAARPHIIEFKRIGDASLGYISVAEKETLPFEVKRVYWTYFTPEDVQRGGHAHYDLEQILLAVAGKIIVKTELLNGEIGEFILDKPNMGLYIPKMCWREMQYTHNAVQICLASIAYSEDDYIRDYDTFKNQTF